MRRVATSFSFSGGGCRTRRSNWNAVGRRGRESATPIVIRAHSYEPIVFLHVDRKVALGGGRGLEIETVATPAVTTNISYIV